MDLAEATVRLFMGDPIGSLEIMPQPTGDPADDNARLLRIAHARMKLKQYEIAITNFNEVIQATHATEQQRLESRRQILFCLTSSGRFEEANIVVDMLIDATRQKISESDTLSMKKANAYRMLAETYYSKSIILRKTDDDMRASFDTLNDALNAVSQAIRITTKIHDPSFDMNTKDFRQAYANSIIWHTWMNTQQQLILRAHTDFGKKLSHETMVDWMATKFEAKLTWDAYPIVRNYYQWKANLHRLRENPQGTIEYAWKMIALIESMRNKYAMSVGSKEALCVLQGAGAAEGLSDSASAIVFYEFVLTHASPEEIDRCYVYESPESIPASLACMNNLAYLIANDQSSSIKTLLRAEQYAEVAVQQSNGDPDIVDTLKIVRKRIQQVRETTADERQ